MAITGASGAIYGLRLLEKLHSRPEVELHALVSRAGRSILALETERTLADLENLAHRWYDPRDMHAPLASGSFPTHGMVIAPCSMRTLSGLAMGVASNLILRAADVTLKERRRLILMVRESPFHLGHLRAMLALTEMGAIIAPPIPSFYHRPETILDLVDHSVDRVLDLLGLPASDAKRWAGT